MRKIRPEEIERSPVKLIGKEWMLVTAGTPDDFNTMTASWGALGQLWNKPVAMVFIRPQRYTYGFTEMYDMLTLSFFGEEYRKALTFCGSRSGRETDKVAETGLTPYATENRGVAFTEARLVLECRKLYSAPLEKTSFTDGSIPGELYPADDFHMMYVAEIVNAWVND